MPFFCEELFASCLTIARELVGAELCPVRAEFAYPKPAYAAEYEALFGCEVRFGAARNQLLISSQWLARPLPGYNPLTAQQALALCAQQRTPDGGEPHQEIVAAVERLLRSQLSAQPRLNDVARTLNLSERPLRRKLAESGVSSAKSIIAYVPSVHFSYCRQARSAWRRLVTRWASTTPANSGAHSNAGPGCRHRMLAARLPELAPRLSWPVCPPLIGRSALPLARGLGDSGSSSAFGPNGGVLAHA